jgi:hypothetical protein
MSIGPFGRLGLGPTGAEIVFTADPTKYDPWHWKKRMSKHETIGGGVTIQDFGVTMKDAVIDIEASIEQFMENSVAASVHALFRTKGAVYHLYDWLGNSFTVFVEEFHPVPHRNLPGSTYSMRVKIMACATLFGSAYAGD